MHMDYSVLIEDHPMMAEAVGSSIWRWLPALQLMRAYSWAEAHALLRGDRQPPVFIITDLQLTDSAPAQTLDNIRSLHPQVPLLALTMLDDAPTRALCTSHGAHYLCKTAASEQLRQTLQDWLGPDHWAHWSQQPALRTHPLSEFTYRQKDILRELANGRSNREIGELLHISEETVRSHIKTLFTRLDVKNRTQASKYYLQHKDGLLPPGV